MHRDVKPHNVMIDHEKRKVGLALHPEYLRLSMVAPFDRLGLSRVLPPRNRIQC